MNPDMPVPPWVFEQLSPPRPPDEPIVQPMDFGTQELVSIGGWERLAPVIMSTLALALSIAAIVLALVR